MMSRFFNDFRKLSGEPENLALRESVRESANAMVGDFRRLKTQLTAVRAGIDGQIDGHVGEINRFSRIWLQTILPPAISMGLYFLIFGQLIGPRIGQMGGYQAVLGDAGVEAVASWVWQQAQDGWPKA